MPAKLFFPDSSFVSVKTRHLSSSVRGGITSPPKLLHSPSEIHGPVFSITALTPFPTVQLNISLSNNYSFLKDLSVKHAKCL